MEERERNTSTDDDLETAGDETRRDERRRGTGGRRCESSRTGDGSLITLQVSDAKRKGTKEDGRKYQQKGRKRLQRVQAGIQICDQNPSLEEEFLLVSSSSSSETNKTNKFLTKNKIPKLFAAEVEAKVKVSDRPLCDELWPRVSPERARNADEPRSELPFSSKRRTKLNRIRMGVPAKFVKIQDKHLRRSLQVLHAEVLTFAVTQLPLVASQRTSLSVQMTQALLSAVPVKSSVAPRQHNKVQKQVTGISLKSPFR
ncbi:hypothetical protein F2P81_022646 [Scophthalmus maximus]|uniref:Uncharacterized protein n=1 Tax=Scophthalmus maximus TaxID=52904 RepID=A0A6A4S0K2_SCOMX|nr:hypothetical protein F2P81_022646 [Scophthalmus maximus]